MSRPECDCGTGLRYAACCGLFHRGAAEPADAVALMRSRFSAFARGEAGYLWRTLAEAHEDRQRDPGDALNDIRRSSMANRYLALKILDSRAPDAQGVAQVLFWAKVFQKGRDHSFVERSDFVHDGFGWRYLRGDMRPAAGAAPAITLDSFRTSE